MMSGAGIMMFDVSGAGSSGLYIEILHKWYELKIKRVVTINRTVMYKLEKWVDIEGMETKIPLGLFKRTYSNRGKW